MTDTDILPRDSIRRSLEDAFSSAPKRERVAQESEDSDIGHLDAPSLLAHFEREHARRQTCREARLALLAFFQDRGGVILQMHNRRDGTPRATRLHFRRNPYAPSDRRAHPISVEAWCQDDALRLPVEFVFEDRAVFTSHMTAWFWVLLELELARINQANGYRHALGGRAASVPIAQVTHPLQRALIAVDQAGPSAPLYDALESLRPLLKTLCLC